MSLSRPLEGCLASFPESAADPFSEPIPLIFSTDEDNKASGRIREGKDTLGVANMMKSARNCLQTN